MPETAYTGPHRMEPAWDLKGEGCLLYSTEHRRLAEIVCILVASPSSNPRGSSLSVHSMPVISVDQLG